MLRFALPLMALLSACAQVPSTTPRPVAEPASRAQLLASPAPALRSAPAPVAPAAPRPAGGGIVADFLDLSFRMESGRTVPSFTRFEGPITVRMTGALPASAGPDLSRLLARLRGEAGIPISLTNSPAANITIEGIPRATLSGAVPKVACFVVPRVSGWAQYRAAQGTSQLDWTTLNRRDRATVFLPADAAPQEIRDCLHEELAQALGPLNDLYRLPDSVFNDDNIHAVLTPFDMKILRAYYDPALANGMSQSEVAQRLPAIFARIGAPSGRNGGPTSRSYITSLETALVGGRPAATRQAAAGRAVAEATSRGWTGPRLGFANYALGRLSVGTNPARARQAFYAAEAQFAASPRTQLHRAHTAAQLAAFALRDGDTASVLRLTSQAIPTAKRYENPALLATLLMTKAHALRLDGRTAEAQSAHLDSLRAARYGFGSDANIQAQLQQIAQLRPLR